MVSGITGRFAARREALILLAYLVFVCAGIGTVLVPELREDGEAPTAKQDVPFQGHARTGR